MSELDEQIWAVVSERGVEASALTYAAALDLRRTLEAEKINGLCVVTDPAARREAQQLTLGKRQPSKQ